MTDMLIQEVNEAVRRDKAERMWQENRGLLIALVVAIIVGTGGGQVYRNWKNEQNARFTTTLVEATGQINGGDVAKAETALKVLVNDARGEQKAIASLWLARAQLKQGDTKAAEKTLETIIQSGARGSAWHDAACVWHTGIRNEWAAGCDASADSPLRSTKLELATADAIAKGDWMKARSLLAQLKDAAKTLPEQRIRAQQLSLLLPPESAPAETDEAKE